MRIWFIRANGETTHNQPDTDLYVPGEPPDYPDRKFNYVTECLHRGFARVGWPAAGDLRDDEWRWRAFAAYGLLMKPHHLRYLAQFAEIEVGDLVLPPTNEQRYTVHVGVVIPPTKHGAANESRAAYYYHYDIGAGDWYENAHRVDVHWAMRADKSHATFYIPEIGGTWLRGFGEIKAGRERVIDMAACAGIPFAL